jgi:hypothetical protein
MRCCVSDVRGIYTDSVCSQAATVRHKPLFGQGGQGGTGRCRPQQLPQSRHTHPDWLTGFQCAGTASGTTAQPLTDMQGACRCSMQHAAKIAGIVWLAGYRTDKFRVGGGGPTNFEISKLRTCYDCS